MLRYLGAVTITPATPKKLSTVFPNEKGKPFNTLIIAQKRGNAGYVYVGDPAMTGEANASLTIPPASAAQVPYANITIGLGSNPLTLDSFSVDGSAGEVIQVSTISD